MSRVTWPFGAEMMPATMTMAVDPRPLTAAVTATTRRSIRCSVGGAHVVLLLCAWRRPRAARPMDPMIRAPIPANGQQAGQHEPRRPVVLGDQHALAGAVRCRSASGRPSSRA